MPVNKFKKFLKQNGFTFARSGKGSHEIWVSHDGKLFSFPATHEIHKGILWNFQRNFC